MIVTTIESIIVFKQEPLLEVDMAIKTEDTGNQFIYLINNALGMCRRQVRKVLHPGSFLHRAVEDDLRETLSHEHSFRYLVKYKRKTGD